MSVVYNTTLKNTRMTAVVTAIDNGGIGSLLFGDVTSFVSTDRKSTRLNSSH